MITCFCFLFQLSSIYEVKPPVSRAKMAQVTKTAIKAIKFYKHVVQSVEKFIQKVRQEATPAYISISCFVCDLCRSLVILYLYIFTVLLHVIFNRFCILVVILAIAHHYHQQWLILHRVVTTDNFFISFQYCMLRTCKNKN